MTDDAHVATSDEADRLAALRRHGILDTPPEEPFDRIVTYVRALCRTPIALVSLVDADRQWFKAKSGVEAEQTALDTSVCALAIRQREVFQIEDLALDPRTSAMSLVTDERASGSMPERPWSPARERPWARSV